MLTFCSSIHACVLMKVLLRNFVSQQKCPQSLLASTTPQPSRLYKVGSAMACASSLSRCLFHIFQLNFSMHFSRTVVSDDAQLAIGVWPSAGVRTVAVRSESAPDSRSRQPLHARGCALQSLQRSSPLVLQLARCLHGFKKLTVLKNAFIVCLCSLFRWLESNAFRRHLQDGRFSSVQGDLRHDAGWPSDVAALLAASPQPVLQVVRALANEHRPTGARPACLFLQPSLQF